MWDILSHNQIDCYKSDFHFDPFKPTWQEGGDRLSVKTDAVRRSPLPEGLQSEPVSVRESFKDFLTRLSVYDTIGLDISDDMKTMISKKKEREESKDAG